MLPLACRVSTSSPALCLALRKPTHMQVREACFPWAPPDMSGPRLSTTLLYAYGMMHIRLFSHSLAGTRATPRYNGPLGLVVCRRHTMPVVIATSTLRCTSHHRRSPSKTPGSFMQVARSWRAFIAEHRQRGPGHVSSWPVLQHLQGLHHTIFDDGREALVRPNNPCPGARGGPGPCPGL